MQPYSGGMWEMRDRPDRNYDSRFIDLIHIDCSFNRPSRSNGPTTSWTDKSGWDIDPGRPGGTPRSPRSKKRDLRAEMERLKQFYKLGPVGNVVGGFTVDTGESIHIGENLSEDCEDSDRGSTYDSLYKILGFIFDVAKGIVVVHLVAKAAGPYVGFIFGVLDSLIWDEIGESSFKMNEDFWELYQKKSSSLVDLYKEGYGEVVKIANGNVLEKVEKVANGNDIDEKENGWERINNLDRYEKFKPLESPSFEMKDMCGKVVLLPQGMIRKLHYCGKLGGESLFPCTSGRMTFYQKFIEFDQKCHYFYEEIHVKVRVPKEEAWPAVRCPHHQLVKQIGPSTFDHRCYRIYVCLGHYKPNFLSGKKEKMNVRSIFKEVIHADKQVEEKRNEKEEMETMERNVREFWLRRG